MQRKVKDTQVLPVSTEDLVLPCHARGILSRLRCNEHSLKSTELRYAYAETTVLEHFLSHSVLPSYGLFAPFALRRLCFSIRALAKA